jgi:branched-chain amino acid aminotransferase
VTVAVWYDGQWHEEQPRILGPMDHAFWMASVVFDGARSFSRMAPDLDRHCERVVRSARSLLLEPTHSAREIEALAREGVRRFAEDAELYVRPMFFAMSGFVVPDPDSTRFALVIHEAPMPQPTGMSVCFSRYRRPTPDSAPTEAKASCLYPNMQRALSEARAQGFANAVTLDANGNVAELASANVWMVRNGVALTPVANGTFLAGITRARVLELLREDGIEARESTLTPDDLEQADELFSTGNWGKVLPITRLGARELPIGPVARRARELYMAFARQQTVG